MLVSRTKEVGLETESQENVLNLNEQDYKEPGSYSPQIPRQRIED